MTETNDTVYTFLVPLTDEAVVNTKMEGKHVRNELRFLQSGIQQMILATAYFLATNANTKSLDLDDQARVRLIVNKIMGLWISNKSLSDFNKYVVKHRFLLNLFLNAFVSALRHDTFLESFRLGINGAKSVSEEFKSNTEIWVKQIVPKIQPLLLNAFAVEYTIDPKSGAATLAILCDPPSPVRSPTVPAN